MTWISWSFGYFLAILFMNLMNSPVRFLGKHVPVTLPVRISRAANRFVVPCRI